MKKTLFAVGALLIGLCIYGAAGYFLHPTDKSLQFSVESDEQIIGSPASYSADFNNPRILLGNSQDVFAVKILEKISDVPDPALPIQPHTQYNARVLYNIKGNAVGLVVIDLTLAAPNDQLKSGTTYLLAARHRDERGPWYYVSIHPARRTEVSNESRLSDDQLIELIKRHPRTYELLNAYPNEILFNGDVQRGWTFNSFQSLSEEGKQVVYGKFSQLMPPRDVPELLPNPPIPEPIRPTEDGWDTCLDGKDNDNDGLVDRADSNCQSLLRENNRSLCGDRIDSDGDGLIDSADPDCAQFYPPPPAPLPPPPIAPPPPAPTSTPPAPVPAPLAPTSTGQ